jgi:hypothetical protein
VPTPVLGQIASASKPTVLDVTEGAKIRSGCLPGENTINGVVTSLGPGNDYSVRWEGFQTDIGYTSEELKQNLDSGEFKLLK